jgi:hypothetical protein
MFIALFLRNNDVHIVNYRQGDGSYRTICNKTVRLSGKLNTLAVSNTFPGICRICKIDYDKSYHSNLEKFTALSHNVWQSVITYLRSSHYNEFLGPKNMAESRIERRWGKLSKYLRITNRKNKYV